MTVSLAKTPAVKFGSCSSCPAVCATLTCEGGMWVCSDCSPTEMSFVFDLTEIAHVTASVVTQNSTYVVVARSRYGVRVVCPSGEVLEGTHLHMVGGRLYVRDNDTDTTVLRTSTVKDVIVHEN